MIILFCFLFPLLLFVLLQRLFTPTRHKLLIIAVLIIAFTSGAANFAARLNERWPEGTQIVWTGIEAADGILNIGGIREESLVGWPNGSFSPKVSATYVSEKKVSLNISGGGAFVFNDTRGEFLNGTTLEPNVAQKIDDLGVKLNVSIFFGADTIDVTDVAGKVLTQLEIPSANRKKDQIISLLSLVGRKAPETPEEAARIVQVEEWAARKRLMRTRDGRVMLLGGELVRRTCDIPCRLTLQWPNQRLPILINGDGKRLATVFLPPWRRASPLPPKDESGNRKVIITGNVRPGDVAFNLPVGYGSQDPRRLVEFGVDENQLPVFKKGPGVTWGQTPPPIYLPQELQPARDEEVLGTGTQLTSHLSMQIGDTPSSLALATVNDLPRAKGIALLLLLAFSVLAIGLILVDPELKEQRLILGLVACVWNFMAFRLLMALRFALEPNFLDDLTVKGVSLAFAGLVLVPGLILLWVRLRWHLIKVATSWDEKSRACLVSLIYWLVLTAALWTTWFFAPRLWANMQARFLPPLLWILILQILLMYVLGVILVLYRTNHDDTRISFYLFVFLGPLRFDVWLSQMARDLWARLAEITVSKWYGAISLGSSLLVISVAVFILLPFVLYRGLAQFIMPSLVREVFVLFFFCLVPALTWLASRNYHTAKQTRVAGWTKQLFLAFIIILPVVFAVPILVDDAGSILETLAIFIPTTLILLARFPLRTGIASLIALIVLFAGATLVYKNLIRLIPIMPGESDVRLLVFREGPDAVSRVLFADTSGTGDISLHKLRDAYQHAWEDQAMVYEGQWIGLGYGNAPTRLSQVRQDTLQYDSLYSFFVASEYGFVGSISLLLLYGAPLILLIISSWRLRFDYGRATGAVILTAFWMEAVFHAGMNVGAFPLTGRNIPFASINSLTDLLRWTLLFAFAAQAILWRFALRTNPLKGEGSTATSEIRESAFLAEVRSSPSPNTGAGISVATRVRSSLHYLIGVSIVLSIPMLMFGSVIWTNIKVVENSNYQNPFEWKGVLARAQGMISDGLIKVNPQTGEIIPNFPFDVPSGALIQQEILRFNALSLDEKIEGAGDKNFEANLKGIRGVEDFNVLLDQLRRDEITEQRSARPSLFRILPPLKWYNGTRIETRGGYRLSTNPAFNSQLNFRAGSNPEDFPRVRFRDGDKVLIGPAWVAGKWITAFDPDVRLSWLKLLSRAMDAEWKRLKNTQESQRRYGRLSLDESLQLAAIRFTADKGKDAFVNMFEKRANEAANTIAKADNETDELPLPPRVALTVLNFSGEVLALGGYPRMTAGNEWRGDMNEGWLPSSEWVEQEAPHSLRSLFGGDRNFDRIVVGSASKPIWAEAVLSVHNTLETRFAVNGTGGFENDVFGIPINGDPWEVGGSSWTTFTQYLSNSDNRYQVRLGFLGLAVANSDEIQVDGASASLKESMNGGKTAWRRYPKFPGTIVFGKSSPQRMSGLADTPLAHNFARMFAVVTGENKYADRYSFWTKKEADDRDVGDKTGDQRNSDRATRLFASISPERTNLNLKEVGDPRHYITLLLGGGSNRWANVDLAAAFGTCLTGKPLVAHIVRNDVPFDYFDEASDPESRNVFNAIAAKVRPGLEQVVVNGTATQRLKEVGVSSYLSQLKGKGYRIYAKTGTLHSTGTRDMSRIILAIVRWKDETKGEVASGLILSLVSERAETGVATTWMGEFLNTYQKDINRLLGN